VAGVESKPASAARIYDYFLGGSHNLPADRAAADAVLLRFPLTAAVARNNRAFVRRAVRFLATAGVTQYLDVGSGIPTEGNVHEIAGDARVVYVDLDPTAVAESQEILGASTRTTANLGDLREPGAVLAHPELRRLLDLDRPVALLLNAVLHFVPDDGQAQAAVSELVAALAPGSHLVLSHVSVDGQDVDGGDLRFVEDTYERQTTTPFRPRSRAQVERFFTGLDLVEPGLVWLPSWRPAPDDPTDFTADPPTSSVLAGVARL